MAGKARGRQHRLPRVRGTAKQPPWGLTPWGSQNQQRFWGKKRKTQLLSSSSQAHGAETASSNKTCFCVSPSTALSRQHVPLSIPLPVPVPYLGPGPRLDAAGL